MARVASDYLRIKALFFKVCDLPDAAAQRRALEASGADEAAIERVMQLLRSDRRPAPVLDLLGHLRRALPGLRRR
jgi:hypothetical protein